MTSYSPSTRQWLAIVVLITLLAACQLTTEPTPTITPTSTRSVIPTTTATTIPIAPAKPATSGERLTLLDDFEDDPLQSGRDGTAQIGFLTWSDGSPVSIQPLKVAAGDPLALPGQTGINTILQLNTEIKLGGWAGFSHALANATLDRWTPQDWNSYEGIALWLYGNGSGGTLYIDLLDNRNPGSQRDDAERWSYYIIDDFKGWRYLKIPFEDFRRKDIGNGAPNDGLTLTAMHGYAIGASGSVAMGKQANYIDQVALYGLVSERPVQVSFSRDTASPREGGIATFWVTLSNPVTKTISVDYYAAEGTAIPGKDFLLPGRTLTFAPGVREQELRVNTIDNNKADGQRKVVLALNNPQGAVLGAVSRAVLTIRDDDPADPNLLSDFDTLPPFTVSPGITLALTTIGNKSTLALPGQTEEESVLQVTYQTGATPGSLGTRFATVQNWGDKKGLDFWFYGGNTGQLLAVEILSNKVTREVPPQEWVLVWSDEFNDPAGTPPNPSVWQPEIGDGLLNSIPGWGNSELEYYTASLENAATDGRGNLAITARQVSNGASKPICWYGPCEYTSARLITQGRVEFTYGRVEARMKLPQGQGLWPAFWMLGANLADVGWPQSGEIDIIENLGREPTTVHGTIHGPGYSGTKGIGQGYNLPVGKVSDDFHVYAVEWQPNVIRWLVDGVNYFTVRSDQIPAGSAWVYNQPFFLILNLAVGGNWPGSPDKTTTFPQTLLVDYVRVYQNPSAYERYEATFQDDFTGWRQISLPFARFARSPVQDQNAPNKGLNLTEVWGYGWRVPANSHGSYYLDKVSFTP